MNIETKPYTGKRILIWFIGFFLVVFVANGIMTYFALNTWTGLTTDNAYVKGLNYNDEIENAKMQSESGWAVTVTNKPNTTKDRIEVTLKRPTESLPPALVSARFIRAVQEGYDQEIILTHTGNGNYAAPVNLPLSGQWDVLIVVKSQNNRIFKVKDWILVN